MMTEIEERSETRYGVASLHIVALAQHGFPDPADLGEGYEISAQAPQFEDLDALFGLLADFFCWSYVAGTLVKPGAEGLQTPRERYVYEYEADDSDPWSPRTSRPVVPTSRESQIMKVGATWQPRIRRLSMGSPLEIVGEIPVQFLVGGGLVGMLALGERLFTFPIRLSARWSKYRADKAEDDLRRAKASRRLDEISESLSGPARRQITAVAIYDEDEEPPTPD
jgi:hypothetical protein